jgi:hypothetical protein
VKFYGQKVQNAKTILKQSIITEEEKDESIRKVGVLWSGDFSKQRNRKQKRKCHYSCPLGSSSK